MSEHNMIIEQIVTYIQEHYIITENIEQICSFLKEQDGSGTYAHLNGEELAATLTRQLREVSNDKHFRAIFSEEPLPIREQVDEESPEEIEAFRRRARRNNFGCHKLERLGGNIGYWQIRTFTDLIDFSGNTFTSCMGFLAHSDSLIIDLRHNTGGDPEAVSLVASFLFDIEPVHLITLEGKQGRSVRQYWTLPHIPSTRFIDKDVFVLVNNKTFSAPESFAYSVQALGRAVVIGQPTAGAAHARQQFRISDHLLLNIPTDRPIHPLTNSNWEGTGVQPDIVVPEEDILKMGHFLALKRLKEKTTTDLILLDEVTQTLQEFDHTFEPAYQQLTQLFGKKPKE